MFTSYAKSISKRAPEFDPQLHRLQSFMSLLSLLVLPVMQPAPPSIPPLSPPSTRPSALIYLSRAAHTTSTPGVNWSYASRWTRYRRLRCTSFFEDVAADEHWGRWRLFTSTSPKRNATQLRSSRWLKSWNMMARVPVAMPQRHPRGEDGSTCDLDISLRRAVIASIVKCPIETLPFLPNQNIKILIPILILISCSASRRSNSRWF